MRLVRGLIHHIFQTKKEDCFHEYDTMTCLSIHIHTSRNRFLLIFQNLNYYFISRLKTFKNEIYREINESTTLTNF